MSTHETVLKVIRAQMVMAIDEVKAFAQLRELDNKEKMFKQVLRCIEYRYQDIMARFGFTYLGAGARRIGFSYTHNGVTYVVKGDKEPNDFILDERPCATGNLADWVANETLVKMYPVMKPMVAVIYGGFDIDDCLFLVQEPLTVANQCVGGNYDSLNTTENKHRRRLIAALVNDISCNGDNYGVDSDGNLKVSDLDRFQFEKAISHAAKDGIETYQRWEQSKLQKQEA